MTTIWQDIRHALRTLAKSPGFTVVALATLALGIGANTALFSVVNGVLLNPLPYPHPEQLVTLSESKPNFDRGSISYPNFRDWQRDNRTFEKMAVSRATAFSLTGMGDAERVRADYVSSDFFSILGVKPIIGRDFAVHEDEPGAGPVVLLGGGYWKSRFAGSPGVLGKSITLDSRAYTIVGVIPEDFDLHISSFRTAMVYVPLGQWENPLLNDRSAGLGMHGIGRLRPGLSLAQAQADMDAVSHRLAETYPDSDTAIGAKLDSLRNAIVGRVRPLLLVLLGAVGFVLLIACVNVANLMLARSTGRAREFAVRCALGASRARVVQQLLAESMTLALTGGALGLLAARWGTQAALHALPVGLPRAHEVSVDFRVLLFTLVASLLCGVVFGLFPALRLSNAGVQQALQEGGRGGTAGSHRAHRALVAAELAMALVLLCGAGLMVRTLERLWSVNPGFNPHDALIFNVWLPPAMQHAPPGAIRAAFRDLDARISALPGVQALSLSWGATPLSGDDEQRFWLAGRPKPARSSDMDQALSYVVEPDYLKVMQIPLLRGRFFTPKDDEHTSNVMLVDDVFARKFFGTTDPIGKRIEFDSTSETIGPAEIVGVVGHVKQWGLDTDDTEALRAQLYTPFMQLRDEAMALAPSGTSVVVRSAVPAQALFKSLQEISRRMSNQQVVSGMQTFEEIISDSLAARRFAMALLATFAAFALLLAAIGIYGVISYLVGQRTREIGIRLALGAQQHHVLRMVLGQGARMALLGMVLGLAAALGLTQLLARYSLLFGVSAADPITFAAVMLLLLLVTLLACYIPARRAMRVDPLVALRYE